MRVLFALLSCAAAIKEARTGFDFPKKHPSLGALKGLGAARRAAITTRRRRARAEPSGHCKTGVAWSGRRRDHDASATRARRRAHQGPDQGPRPRRQPNVAVPSRCIARSSRGRIAATPRGVTWIFRGRDRRTKIDGHRRSIGRVRWVVWAHGLRGADRGDAAGRDVDIPRATECARSTATDNREEELPGCCRLRRWEQRGAGVFLNILPEFWRNSSRASRARRRSSANAVVHGRSTWQPRRRRDP